MDMLAEAGKSALAALLSLAGVFVVTRIMGAKQVSQMTLFDYVVGISIGSVAGELAVNPERTTEAVTALAVHGLAAWIISRVVECSLKARKAVAGKPKILLDAGRIHRENLKRAHMDLSEFLSLCRSQGYFDLGQIQIAVLEPNGAVSILPKAICRPATPEDLELRPRQTRLAIPFIMDGALLPENIRNAGKEESWVHRALLRQGYHSEKAVLLALWNGGEQMTVFPDGSVPESS